MCISTPGVWCCLHESLDSWATLPPGSEQTKSCKQNGSYATLASTDNWLALKERHLDRDRCHWQQVLGIMSLNLPRGSKYPVPNL